MKITIGIDTGGTYTDAVLYDLDDQSVRAQAKARTTKNDLTIGIHQALDQLPLASFPDVHAVILSTTLATNACVEGKGGRAKLVLLGTRHDVLRRIDSRDVYGIDENTTLCINTRSTFDGSIVDHPNWDEVIRDNRSWFEEADALAICEMNAMNNGGAAERCGARRLSETFDVPVVIASDLADGLNMMERGATALLNARLLPVVEGFLHAARVCLQSRGIDHVPLILRSDTGIMPSSLSASRPVETILSGPAASVCGGMRLAAEETCLVIDMGGTTTDIALVEKGKPQMSQTTRIGTWKTQVKGVKVDTVGLGGDSRVILREGGIDLSTQRVESLCAAAQRYPELLDSLRKLAERRIKPPLPLFEALCLVKFPQNLTGFTEAEKELMNLLREGPRLLVDLDVFSLKTERLEAEGHILRCGFTPTDAMVIQGDFARYDAEASLIAARYICDALALRSDDGTDAKALCESVYDAVCAKLYDAIIGALMTRRYPQACENGIGDQLLKIIRQSRQDRVSANAESFFTLDFTPRAALVGLGAPAHIFLPRVASLMGARCIIPDHAEAANAVGAAIARVSTDSFAHVRPVYDSFGIVGYTVHGASKVVRAKTKNDALDTARRLATEQARHEAVSRGAPDGCEVVVSIKERSARAGDGQTLELGITVTATIDVTL